MKYTREITIPAIACSRLRKFIPNLFKYVQYPHPSLTKNVESAETKPNLNSEFKQIFTVAISQLYISVWHHSTTKPIKVIIFHLDTYHHNYNFITEKHANAEM